MKNNKKSQLRWDPPTKKGENQRDYKDKTWKVTWYVITEVKGNTLLMNVIMWNQRTKRHRVM